MTVLQVLHRRQISGKWYEVKLFLLNEKEEILAKRFKIVLAEAPNLQEAGERSRNNWQNEQKQKQ